MVRSLLSKSSICQEADPCLCLQLKSGLKVAYVNIGVSWIENPESFARQQKATLLYKEELAKKHEVHYFLRTNCAMHRKLNGVNLRSLPLSCVFALVRLIVLLRKLSPDVIIVHGLHYAHFIMLLKRLVRSDYFVQHHGEVLFGSRLRRTLLRTASAYVRGFFFNGIGVAAPFVDAGCFPIEKVFAVTEGTTDFTAAPDQEVDPNTLVFIGRLDENKNLHTLLKALTRTVSLTFVLEVYYSDNLLEADLKRFCFENGLAQKVQFRGNVRHEDIPAILGRARAFISCSFREGSGYALIEALACGTLPVVSKIGAFDYLVSDLAEARQFEPADDQALSMHLYEVLTNKPDPAERARIRAHFQKRCSPEAIAQQVMEVIGR